MYLSGGDNYISLNRVHDHPGYGIHNYWSGTCRCELAATGTRITRNRVYNNQSGMTTKGAVLGVLIDNNLVYRNTNYGMNVGGCTTSENHRVINNTSILNGQAGLRIFDDSHNVLILNNLIGRSLEALSGAQNTTLTTNYVWCPTCTAPQFVDQANDDFRLLPTDTNLVDTGTSPIAQGVTWDVAGAARCQGAGCDIGAYETSAGTGAPFDFALRSNVVEEEEPQVVQGAMANVTVTVVALAGSAASVAFTAVNLPPQTTASFVPATCTPSGGTCSTTLTLDTANATPEGGYEVTVRGLSGQATRTTSVPINVTCN
jgi:hypothetical protein